MTEHGQSHSDAGISKRVSEPVYPADIIADTALQQCDLLTRGAWYECLWRMWRDRTYKIEGTVTSLARLWGCTEEEVGHVITELIVHSPCDVTQCSNKITLLSRRLQRRELQRIANKKRQKAYREKDRNGDVTEKNNGPSSSSVSSSVSSTKETKEKRSKRFQKPTAAEVTEYAASIDFHLDGEVFVDFYEQKGWMVGKSPMKNWQAAVRTWKRRDNGRSTSGNNLVDEKGYLVG